MRLKEQMAITHNLTADNLLFASEMGGLVCPSLAVINTIHEYKNFGEITLLMNPKKVNFRTTPAYTSDTSTARYPTCYYQWSRVTMERFSEKVQSLTADLSNIHTRAGYLEDSDLKKGAKHNSQRFYDDIRVMLTFFRERGDNPRVYRKERTSGISILDNLKDGRRYLKKLAQFDMRQDPDGKTLVPLFQEAMSHYYKDFAMKRLKLSESDLDNPENAAYLKEEIEYMETHYTKMYLQEVNGEIAPTFTALRKASDYASGCKKDPKPVDTIKVSKSLLGRLKKSPSLDSEYKTWIDKQIQSAFHTPYFYAEGKNSRRKAAYTAQNLLKAMKHKGNGAESGLFLGANSVRAHCAKSMTSLRQVSENISRLVPRETMKDIGSKLSDKLSDLPDILAPYYLYQTNSMHYRDAVYEEIVDYARRCRNVNALESFKDIDSDALEAINSLMDALENAPSEYFEVKFNKVVTLDDFDVAIVPKNTCKSVLDTLQAQGVKIKTYDPDKEHSRSIAINTQEALLFGATGKTLSLNQDVQPELELSI